ncbi:MAG: hypothetical protein CVU15_03050 [Betaproteobacteria bacterium HGW-Betaproteobacteria-1]|jgi:hypothetical protein|nr:MAG: hypothetical protein CVU15_03050 [Betaproteobacteria bacterium HGW-Betaproteobacteria-1]
MKRYRILPFFDFDTRVHTLVDPIDEKWEERIKAQHYKNRENTILRLKAEFGELHFEVKVQNFIDLEAKPISVIAFHNEFFAQVRTAFVMGAYYPALTGACALGERILNHLILSLRENYRSTPEYKAVYRKDSFDDWSLAINTLQAWDVLLPQAVQDFRALMQQRHKAIHFSPETDHNARELALEAIKSLQAIIGEQFSGWGPQPWFITTIPGEIYIKKEWETRPFIAKVYLPNASFVGYKHRIEAIRPQVHIVDPDHNTDTPEVSDDEFSNLRQAFNQGGQTG